MRRLHVLALVFLAAALIPLESNAQLPTIAANGIRNGASYALPGLPNSSIAQGSIIVIFGSNLGPASIVQVSSFPLPTAAGLAGTRVTVTVGSTTLDAIMLYTLNTQVAAVLPSNTPVGTGTVRVIYNGQTSNAAPFTVTARSFGIFALNQAGSGPGVIQNVNSEADRPFNGAKRPARPNQVMILWGTGIGPVSGNEAGSALPGDMSNVNLRVFVGMQEAQIQYKGRSGCCVGIDQIVFTVPPGTSGCSVPVYIVVDGVVSNFVSISVAATGNTCSDPGGYSDSDIDLATANGGLRVSTLAVQRFFLRTIGFPNLFPRFDSTSAVYGRVPLATILNAQGSPAIGSCMVLPIPAPQLPPNTPLNAGAVSVSGPVGNRTLAMTAPGSYSLSFQPGNPFPGPGVITDGTVVTAGTYNFTATAGNEVGAHNASVNHPATFVWTQYETISTNLPRSQGLVVNWTGGSAGGTVAITGTSQSAPGVGAYFVCFADAAANSFTVPGTILSALPVPYSQSGVIMGSLFVVHTKLANISIPGTDQAYIGAFDGYNVGPINFQ